MTWHLCTPSPKLVTWRPLGGSQCILPRRPRAKCPQTAGDETSPAHYHGGHVWEPGGVVGGSWSPGSPVLLLEGGDSALPRPCEPPELRQRTDRARSSSCPRPAPGDVSVHTYTHSGGSAALSGAQVSPASARWWRKQGRGGGRHPTRGMLGEGAPTRTEKR